MWGDTHVVPETCTVAREMTRTQPQMVVRGVLGLLITAACVKCGGPPVSAQPAQWVATDGQVMIPRYDPAHYGYEGGDPQILPVRASGAHDLRCPVEQVTARNLHARREEMYAAEGCQQRAVYLITRRTGPLDVFDCVLTGIVPLSTSGAQ